MSLRTMGSYDVQICGDAALGMCGAAGTLHSATAVLRNLSWKTLVCSEIFSMGKTFILIGALLAAVGALMMLLERAGISLGHLPGDIRIEGKRGGFYFPVVTCILLSVVGSLLLSLFGKK